MAKLHLRCFMITTLLISFALPSLQCSSSRPSLSLQLHLQPPPLNLHNATCNNIQQPLTPYLFADQPLSHFDESTQAYVNVGSAHGLYLADPAASMELRYLFFTATLRKHQGGELDIVSRELAEGGSMVLMGSLDSGAISVIGGTGSFTFASGQAKVSMAGAGLESEQLRVFLDIELQDEEEDAKIASI